MMFPPIDPSVLNGNPQFDKLYSYLTTVALNPSGASRSEEHTSELQSQSNIVCRLLLEKKITRTENILHRNFTRRQVAIQNRVASNIGISQSTFSVKVLNLFSRSRRKTNKRKSKHSAMLRNKETRHRMFIGLFFFFKKPAPPHFFTFTNHIALRT